MPLCRSAAAADHEVAGAGGQVLAGDVERGQRRGAGGVDGEVGAAQVEPVGDPARDHVGQHAGEGVLGHPGQRFVQLARHLAEVGRAGSSAGSWRWLRSLPSSAPKTTPVRLWSTLASPAPPFG